MSSFAGVFRRYQFYEALAPGIRKMTPSVEPVGRAHLSLREPRGTLIEKPTGRKDISVMTECGKKMTETKQEEGVP